MNKIDLDKELNRLATRFVGYLREMLEKEVEIAKMRLNAFDEERARKRFKDAMLETFEKIDSIFKER